MHKLLSIVSVLVLAATAVGLSATPALAWQVGHGAESICVEESANISWTFKNKEPNEDRYKIDLVVRDKQSGNETAIQTVNPGQTVTGQIDTGGEKISNGTVEYVMTWTDGRNGVDTRTSTYSTIDCHQDEPEVCEYDATLPKDHPDCKKPVCEYNPELAPDHPDCKAPVCEYNPDLAPNDPDCKAPVCEYDPALTPDDPDCKEDEKPKVLPAVLPNTGAASTLGMALTAGVATFAISKRYSKE